MSLEVVEAINETKSLVFTVTTGRSGTAYLAEMLGRIPGVTSVHEESPDFVQCMRAVQGNPMLAKDFLLNEKLPSILNVKDSVYIETLHLFCKGFLEPMLDIGINPKLILLHRSEREVAKSLWQLGTIPGRTENGLKYLLYPGDQVFLQLPNWQEYDDYQLCYWYCLEISERANRYSRLIEDQGSRAVKAEFEDIKEFAGLRRIQEGLGLPQFSLVDKTRLSISKPKPVNAKSDRKKHWDLESEVETMERVVRDSIIVQP